MMNTAHYAPNPITPLAQYTPTLDTYFSKLITELMVP